MKTLTTNEIKIIAGAVECYAFKIKQSNQSDNCFVDFMQFSNSTDIGTQEKIIKFAKPIANALTGKTQQNYTFKINLLLDNIIKDVL